MLKTPAREIRVPRFISGPATSYYLLESRRLSPEEILNPNPANAVIQPGKYTLSAEGGRDLPSFSEEFEVSPLVITRPSGTLTAPGMISGQAPMTIEWTGGDNANGPASVSVSLYGSAATDRYQVLCQLKDAREGKFTIPESAWSAVPARVRAGSIAVVSVVGGMQKTLPVPGTDGLDLIVPVPFSFVYGMLTP